MLTFANRPLILLAALFLPAGALQGADWPGFRGPNGDGSSSESLEGSRFEVVWRKNVGIGTSNIIVASGKAYALGNSRDVTSIYCLDPATGNSLWTKGFPSPGEEKNGPPFLGGPAATPLVSGGRLYVAGRFGDLLCLDATSGELVWQIDFVDLFPNREIPQWGYCASPLIDGDRLYVEPGGKGHTTACLDKNTGKSLWSTGDEGSACSTPAIAEISGTRSLLAFTKSALVCRDSASGVALWSIPWNSFRSVHVATPLLIEDRYLFLSTRFTEGGKLFDLSTGKPVQIWHNGKVKDYHSNFHYRDGHLYGFSTDRLTCLRLSDGEILWSESGLGHGKLTMAQGNRVLVQGESGQLVLAEMDPSGYRPVTSIEVFNRVTYSAPAISDGRIFCRSTYGEVACLRLAK